MRISGGDSLLKSRKSKMTRIVASRVKTCNQREFGGLHHGVYDKEASKLASSSIVISICYLVESTYYTQRRKMNT